MPLNDSLLPLSQGFPGSMSAVPMLACTSELNHRHADFLLEKFARWESLEEQRARSA
jgi:hypothetical protein